MNLLYVSSFNSDIKAGYYSAVTERLNHLNSNVRVNVISLNFDDGSHNTENVDFNIKTFSLFRSGPIIHYITEFLQFLIIAIVAYVKKVDVVHVHWAYPIGYSAVRAARCLGLPVVVTCHGSDIHTHPYRYSYIFKKTKYCLDKSTVIMTVGSALKRDIVEHFNIDPDKILVSFNGIDLSYLTNRKCSTKDKNEQICFIGNLNETKGADLLPIFHKALVDLIGREIRVVVLGDGPMKQRLLDSCPEESFSFLGHVSKELVISTISNSQLTISLSRKEGFGLVAIESFALGTPCVAFDIPGLADAFEFHPELMVGDENNLSDYVDVCASILNGIVNSVDSHKYTEKYNITTVVSGEIDVYETIS